MSHSLYCLVSLSHLPNNINHQVVRSLTLFVASVQSSCLSVFASLVVKKERDEEEKMCLVFDVVVSFDTYLLHEAS
jgi:hypothetical protein